MKLIQKSRLINLLIILGIFSLLPIFTFNSIFTYRECKFNYDIKISKILEPIYIYIDDHSLTNNWSIAKQASICTGNGTYSDPYVIEDLVIESPVKPGGGGEKCIRIKNSNVFFIIRNCTIINAGSGISLGSVNNSLIENNTFLVCQYSLSLGDCENNTVANNQIRNSLYGGIGLLSSCNNIISGNFINNNGFEGIELTFSENNTLVGNTIRNGKREGISLAYSSFNNISGNSVINNSHSGIGLHKSHNTSVTGNTANYNTYSGLGLSHSNNTSVMGNTFNYNSRGIFLVSSHYNIVSGNILIKNNLCILLRDSSENIFEDNGKCSIVTEIPLIPGFNPFIIIGLLSSAAILIRKRIISDGEWFK